MNNKHNTQISLMDVPGQFLQVSKEVMPEILRVLKSGRYIMGPEVSSFEDEFAKFCDAKFCIGTSSGTESLVLALRALGVGRGDEVITVPNTFTATAEAICLVGAKPVFCEIDSQTANMDTVFLKKIINQRTKAIIPVHLHGNPVDMDEIYKIIKGKKIYVIEDAAQAHGAIYKNKKVGSLKSEFTSFSFHPVKNLGAFGDGGALVTNSKKLADKVRLLINHGRSSHHEHVLVGTTGRLDAVQAAVLRIKLRYLNNWNNSKQKLVDYYRSKMQDKYQLIHVTKKSVSANHVFAALFPKRNKLAEFLKQKGIETGMHYPIPLHLQPAYKNLAYKKGDFPVAEKYAETTLSLPLYPHMSKSQIDYIVKSINEFYEHS